MGEKVARKIESATAKPMGWLDANDLNIDLASIGVSLIPLIDYVQAGQSRETLPNAIQDPSV